MGILFSGIREKQGWGWGGKRAPLSQPGHPLEVSVLVAPSLSVSAETSAQMKPELLTSGQAEELSLCAAGLRERFLSRFQLGIRERERERH